VITGFAGAEFGVRGRVKAYNADDGSLAWTFYTVPGPGEVGHDTWPQDNDVYLYGGATVWQTPAVDPTLDLVYFSTGNPGSQPRLSRSTDIPASTAGTFSRFTTTSGTTTHPARFCCSTSRSTARRGEPWRSPARPAGSIFWIARPANR